MGEKLLGMYRGIVEDTDDPQERKRYRVRVLPVFPEDIPTDRLPWAESCVFGGRSFGDFPHFDRGDRVWVAFEGGDRRFPVVLGGWLSDYTGLNDIPTEITSDYPSTQERWVRIDRQGNKMVMSPLPDESGVYIESGGNAIEVRQHDNTLLIRSGNRVVLDAGAVDIQSDSLVANISGNLLAHVQEEASIRGESRVHIQSADTVYVGRYEDAVLGPLLPYSTPYTSVQATEKVEVVAGGLAGPGAGEVGVSAQGDVSVTTPTNIVLTGGQAVNITSLSEVSVFSPQVSVDASADITVNAAASVTTTAGTTISTTGSDVVVNAANGVTVSAHDITVQSSGRVSLSCAESVQVFAGATASFIVSSGLVNLTALSGDVRCTAPANATVGLSGGVIDLSGGDLRISMTGSVSIFGGGPVSMTSLNALTLDGTAGINIG
jgi:hypothetical protein